MKKKSRKPKKPVRWQTLSGLHIDELADVLNKVTEEPKDPTVGRWVVQAIVGQPGNLSVVLQRTVQD